MTVKWSKLRQTVVRNVGKASIISHNFQIPENLLSPKFDNLGLLAISKIWTVLAVSLSSVA